MTKYIRHSFIFGALPDTMTDALLQEQHVQQWCKRSASARWQRRARVEAYGWTFELDTARDTVPLGNAMKQKEW